MGDLVPFTAERTVQFGLAATGYYLVNAAYNQLANEGLRVTRTALERAVRNGANSVNQLVSHFRRQAQAPKSQSSLEFKMGKRPRKTDDTVPEGQELAPGNVTIGDKAVFTKSHMVCRAQSTRRKLTAYQMLMKNFIQRNIYRWQSIKEFNGTSADRHRSISLNTICLKTSGDVVRTGLPMYAFDLGTIPCQGRGTPLAKTMGLYESVPMYRLMKNTENGALSGCPASLATSVQNYYWAEQFGLSNGPSADFDGKSNALWSNEIIRGFPAAYLGARNIYTYVDLLFKCHRKMPCVVHTSIVRFKNQAGPARKYVYNQQFVQGTVPTFADMEDVSNADKSNADVFWEAFWDSRTAHPLAKYNIAKKMQHIEFLRDEKITIIPEEITLQEPYMHKKSIMISDGGTHNLAYNDEEDAVTSGNFGQQPPVCVKDSAGHGYFDHPYGFNVINKGTNVYEPYDPSNYAREKNTWLLIWMENSVPPQNIAVGTGFDFRDPSVTMPLDVECCSFDIRARRCVDLYTTSNSVPIQ